VVRIGIGFLITVEQSVLGKLSRTLTLPPPVLRGLRNVPVLVKPPARVEGREKRILFEANRVTAVYEIIPDAKIRIYIYMYSRSAAAK